VYIYRRGENKKREKKEAQNGGTSPLKKLVKKKRGAGSPKKKKKRKKPNGGKKGGAKKGERAGNGKTRGKKIPGKKKKKPRVKAGLLDRHSKEDSSVRTRKANKGVLNITGFHRHLTGEKGTYTHGGDPAGPRRGLCSKKKKPKWGTGSPLSQKKKGNASWAYP